MTPNAFTQTTVDVWLVAKAGDDLDFEMVDSPRKGVEPFTWTMRAVVQESSMPTHAFTSLETVGPAAWLKHYLDEDGWDAFLIDSHIAGLKGRETFLLEHGIAPGQPFKVRARMPIVTRDYWGEYDVDIDLAELLEIAPWSPPRTARAWAKRFKDLNTAWVRIAGVKALQEFNESFAKRHGALRTMMGYVR